MQLRKFRLRFRRNIRKHRRQAADFGAVADGNLDRYIVNRISRLWHVRRFVLAWTGLLILLSIASILQSRALTPHYLQLAPAEGGILREGIVGTFTNANPLYAQNDVDMATSKLIFSGLFKYSSTGSLVPDLAEKYTVDSAQTEYKVFLRDNLKWQDGHKLTAKDVAFTYRTIQLPEAKSYLYSSWRGVKVTAIDDKTITFKLDNALSAFPHSLTTGIIPEHLLSTIAPSQLRSIKFNNQEPIGSGPFKMNSVELINKGDEINSNLVLEPNNDFHAGKPKVERFVIKTFKNESDLIDGYKQNAVDTMVGLSTEPTDLDKQSTIINRVPLTSEVMVFFKNSQDVLKDVAVRKALVLGVDKTQTIKTLKYPVLPISEPLVSQQVGFNKTYAQDSNKKLEAASILDSAGWKKETNSSIRQKNGQPLKFKLSSSSKPEFASLTSDLQKQWRDLGVDVEIVLLSDDDIQTAVSSHNYDSLLYGISVGADPDVYAYWHSSQVDIRSTSRLNLSEYKSTVADKALEAGRTRSDNTLRSIKYKPFLEAWQKDYPALALYQQQFLYVTSSNLSGFDNSLMHMSVDRYSNVKDWTIKKSSQVIK